MSDQRNARFDQRREALREMSDDDLKARFWDLTNRVVAPIVDLARTHTSPSIERSVLLRMGIDSVSSHGVVQRIHDAGLLGKGAGHVVLRLSRRSGVDIRTAAQAILDEASALDGLFPEHVGE